MGEALHYQLHHVHSHYHLEMVNKYTLWQEYLIVSGTDKRTSLATYAVYVNLLEYKPYDCFEQCFTGSLNE